MYTYGKDRKKKIYLIVTAVVIVLLVIAAGYFAKSYYDLRANPNKASEEESQRLTNAVGKLYQLPSDETPIVGKVKDKDKLSDQPFFKNAQNDDDILIYQKAKVAIIYRAAENKLINVGPVAIDSAPGQGQASATVKVVSATTNQNAASDAVKKIGEIAGLSVDQTVDNAKKKNLAKTIVVDISGTKSEQTQQIADKIGATISTLPEGEAKPNADIAVFVGAQ